MERTEPTPTQARIMRAMAEMPFGASLTVPDEASEIDLPRVAGYLEELLARVKEHADLCMDRTARYLAIRHDLAAAGRIIALASQLGKDRPFDLMRYGGGEKILDDEATRTE